MTKKKKVQKLQQQKQLKNRTYSLQNTKKHSVNSGCFFIFTQNNNLGVTRKGSGFTLQVLAPPITIGKAVGFSLQSLTQRQTY